MDSTAMQQPGGHTVNHLSNQNVQAFWDARPCNIKHSDKPVGTKQYFDDVEQRKYFVEPHIPAFADFQQWKGKKVLEIGCGIGTDAINFSRFSGHVTAIDVSAYSIQIAKKRNRVFKQNIRFLCADAENPIAELYGQQFDLVYCFGALHHTQNPYMMLVQINKYLKNDGIFKLMVYNKYSLKALYLFLRYGNANNSEAQQGCPVVKVYSKKQIKKLLDDNGFTVVDMFIDHIFPYKVSDYINYKYVKCWYFKILPAFIFKKIESIFGWHLCITAEHNNN